MGFDLLSNLKSLLFLYLVLIPRALPLYLNLLPLKLAAINVLSSPPCSTLTSANLFSMLFETAPTSPISENNFFKVIRMSSKVILGTVDNAN